MFTRLLIILVTVLLLGCTLEPDAGDASNATDEELDRACAELARVRYDYWKLDILNAGGRAIEVAADIHTAHPGPESTQKYCQGRAGVESAPLAVPTSDSVRAETPDTISLATPDTISPAIQEGHTSQNVDGSITVVERTFIDGTPELEVVFIDGTPTGTKAAEEADIANDLDDLKLIYAELEPSDTYEGIQYLNGAIENLSDRRFKHIEATFRLSNPEGTVLRHARPYTENFDVGDVWEFTTVIYRGDLRRVELIALDGF